jgi:pimeloyl-ACP methyl ester carboxylesterase
MPRSRNRLDGRQVYFEDESGDGVPVVFHGGFLDSVADVRESNIAQAVPAGEFRRIYVDHRGLGASDKPHDPAAYAMHVRVADAVGVLDELLIERAHFAGMSWGRQARIRNRRTRPRTRAVPHYRRSAAI